MLETQFSHYSKTDAKNCSNLDNLNEPEMAINTLLNVNVFRNMRYRFGCSA